MYCAPFPCYVCVYLCSFEYLTVSLIGLHFFLILCSPVLSIFSVFLLAVIALPFLSTCSSLVFLFSDFHVVFVSLCFAFSTVVSVHFGRFRSINVCIFLYCLYFVVPTVWISGRISLVDCSRRFSPVYAFPLSRLPLYTL